MAQLRYAALPCPPPDPALLPTHCLQENEGDGSSCLGVGFLPYDLFPRHGRWPDLAARALVYHMTMGCVQEKSPCFSPGVRPFRGNRQRLDRYDETDLDHTHLLTRAL